MTRIARDAPRWSTSAFGEPAGISTTELSVLGHHLRLCRGLQGRWLALLCAVDAMHAFMAARLVTSAMAVLLLAGVGSLAF
jgi:hypothetical protein